MIPKNKASPPARCQRPGCNGTIIPSGDGGVVCLACGRPPERAAAPPVNSRPPAVPRSRSVLKDDYSTDRRHTADYSGNAKHFARRPGEVTGTGAARGGAAQHPATAPAAAAPGGLVAATSSTKVVHPEVGLPPIPPKPVSKGAWLLRRYYCENAAAILADLEKLGEAATTERWGISLAGWYKMKKRGLSSLGQISAAKRYYNRHAPLPAHMRKTCIVEKCPEIARLTAEYSAYRQAIRDLTRQLTFPMPKTAHYAAYREALKNLGMRLGPGVKE